MGIQEDPRQTFSTVKDLVHLCRKVNWLLTSEKLYQDAMEAHGENAEVQEQACIALANLTANNPSSCIEVPKA